MMVVHTDRTKMPVRVGDRVVDLPSDSDEEPWYGLVVAEDFESKSLCIRWDHDPYSDFGRGWHARYYRGDTGHQIEVQQREG